MSRLVEHLIVGSLIVLISFGAVFTYLRFAAMQDDLEMARAQIEAMAYFCNMAPPQPITPQGGLDVRADQ